MQSSRFQSTPPRRRRPGCVFFNSLLQISIHASAKEATSDEELYEVFDIISIHASAKEATVTVNDGLLLQKFQSTPPRRRRQCDPPHYDMDTVFQSTPPRRRRLHTWDGHSLLQHFNPRLREGGDAAGVCVYIILMISIHASAKEATELLDTSCHQLIISIHASAKEATATYCDTSAIMYISSLNNFFVHYF